jgi:hypothetical protein
MGLHGLHNSGFLAVNILIIKYLIKKRVNHKVVARIAGIFLNNGTPNTLFYSAISVPHLGTSLLEHHNS